MDILPDLYPLIHQTPADLRRDVGLLRKVQGGSLIPFIDEVVHDQGVQVTENTSLAFMSPTMNTQKMHASVHVQLQVNLASHMVFQRDSQLAIIASSRRR